MSKINFQITNYSIMDGQNPKVLTINGVKLKPPSKRITLHQPDIKVLNVKIIYKHKKGDIEYEVSRINKIKSFGEVRIHTHSILYPGKYEIMLEFLGKINEGLFQTPKD
jgi:hypothetical protein